MAVHGGDLDGIALVVIAVKLDVGGVQLPFPFVAKAHIITDGHVYLGQTLIVVEFLLAIGIIIVVFFLEPQVNIVSFLIDEEVELLQLLGLTEY